VCVGVCVFVCVCVCEREAVNIDVKYTWTTKHKKNSLTLFTYMLELRQGAFGTKSPNLGK